MNKVLLASSTGFVGKELMRQLLNSNHEVIAIGRTKPEDDVEFIKLDLRDNEVLDKKLAGRKFNYLIHLASLLVDTGNACEMINVNVKGLQNFLEFAKKTNLGK